MSRYHRARYGRAWWLHMPQPPIVEKYCSDEPQFKIEIINNREVSPINTLALLTTTRHHYPQLSSLRKCSRKKSGNISPITIKRIHRCFNYAAKESLHTTENPSLRLYRPTKEIVVSVQNITISSIYAVAKNIGFEVAVRATQQAVYQLFPHLIYQRDTAPYGQWSLHQVAKN